MWTNPNLFPLSRACQSLDIHENHKTLFSKRPPSAATTCLNLSLNLVAMFAEIFIGVVSHSGGTNCIVAIVEDFGKTLHPSNDPTRRNFMNIGACPFPCTLRSIHVNSRTETCCCSAIDWRKHLLTNTKRTENIPFSHFYSANISLISHTVFKLFHFECASPFWDAIPTVSFKFDLATRPITFGNNSNHLVDVTRFDYRPNSYLK